MDLKDMRYFLAVAEEGNFGRAAKRLCIAQPPLSRHIKSLEAELDTVLFVRTPKGVELTDAGRVLLADVPNLLALAQQATERAVLAGRGRIGRLDVGLFGSGVLDVIPRMLAQFHSERPDVRIVLHNLTKTEQLDALRERRITIGFNRLVPPEPGLVVETVLRERLQVALPAHHRLCSKKAVRLADLDGEPLIVYPNLPVRGLAQLVLEAFRLEGIEARVEQEVEDVLTAVALAAGGFGLVVTTQSATNLRLPGVEFRPLEASRLRDLELACIYREDDPSTVLRAFLEVVHTFAREQPKRRRA